MNGRGQNLPIFGARTRTVVFVYVLRKRDIAPLAHPVVYHRIEPSGRFSVALGWTTEYTVVDTALRRHRVPGRRQNNDPSRGLRIRPGGVLQERQ